MKTIKNNTNAELIINKSKFISYPYKVETIEEINTILDNLQKEYHDATHICYAYVLPNSEKMSDDNEPQGTAGLPILEVLKKNNITNTLGVVIRYFGGIKLGSGGLIRAYSNSIRNALNKTEIKELKKGYLIKITEDYKKEKLINNLLINSEIIKKEFKENIYLETKIDEETKTKLENNNINFEIIKEINI